MFTGIVQAMGTVVDLVDSGSKRRFSVQVPEFVGQLSLGESVSVDGACLTVAGLVDAGFFVDVIKPTLDRTIAGTYQEGSIVNLERALRMSDRISGHIVQGHVDTVGHLRSSVRDGNSWILDFNIPGAVLSETINHGSIALNGVSLTVSELVEEQGVRIGMIPHTYEHTNLGRLLPGDPVNVEGDLIGKYVSRIMARRGNPEPTSGL
ncbi:MAG: riboflavin synthase [Gemmatimonadota bacterium]|mgnify:FL=1|nr:riboflavin synthase [Gemmatimonadota bacterium]